MEEDVALGLLASMKRAGELFELANREVVPV